MEQIYISVVLAILGMILGSFAGATVWRLRAHQLVQDKTAHEEVNKKEYEELLPLTKLTVATDRSRCLHCGLILRWYDLLPLVSWLSTRGECRYCKHPIGKFEPLIELGVASFFVGSYLLWSDSISTPLEILQFCLWLISGILLAILFAYDSKWFILPNKVVFTLIGIGFLVAALRIGSAPDALLALIDVGLAAGILSGIYLLLWILSHGRWIGFGDVKLGLALALLLGEWQLAFITLLLANLIGCLVVLPGLLSGRMTRGTHVPFGPLLIVGCVISELFGESIQQWYFAVLSW